jgi:hypothetical protein
LSTSGKPDGGPSLLQAIRRGLGGRAAGQRDKRGQPAIPVTVEVGLRAWELIKEARPQDAVRAQVASAVGHDLRALGIPGQQEIELRPLPDDPDDVRVRVHGRLCPQPAAQIAEILYRLGGPECQSVPDLPAGQVGPGIAALCTGAIQRRPSVLLGEDQLLHYRETIGGISVDQAGLGWPPGAERLRAILTPVLDTGVSIADAAAVASIVAAGEIDAVPPVHVAERVIDSQRSRAVQICLNSETLRALTTQEPEPTGAFSRLREELYTESGALFPDFVFAGVTEMPSGTVAFGINSLTTLPVALPDRHVFQAVAVCLAEELRGHRGWFVCMSVVEDRLKQLELICPDLVGATRDRYPAEWLTAVGRALFREDVPMPSLVNILEHLLDLGHVGDAVDVVRISESVATSAPPAIGSLPEPRDVVSYLRQRSNERLQESFLIRQQGTLLMLGEEPHRMAEELLGHPGRPDDSQAEIILAEVRRQLAAAPGGVCLGVRSVPVRSFLRELLEPEFPLVPVVATQELGSLTVSLES